jgi:hypothetical protein
MTLCINCIFYYDSNKPVEYPEGAEGPCDICNAPPATINNFVKGIASPSLINISGSCPYYLEKE